MKRILALFLALFSFLAVAPAHATLANSSASTRYVSQDLYPALITATSNDTTALALSNAISNLDGKIKHIGAIVKVTNQTGTTPTVQLQLLGSNDGTNFYVLQSKQGSTAGTTASIQTAATGISTASTTTVVVGFDVEQFNRDGGFPPYLKIGVAVGGTSTPGWTGVVSGTIGR